MPNELYPLQFKPILKERIWGGTKLHDILNKPYLSETIGESWELSAVKDDVSVVSNGSFAGKSLDELIKSYPEEILGTAVFEKFGTEFPLLFKFIDAREDLSIQLHPNDALAKERHNSFGKTEMWYVMHAEPEARLIVGFKKDSSPEEFLHHIKNKTLTTILNEIPVQAGDVFFLETGIIHAIGSGVLLAEIQQTSDITYRVYDWDRVDANGKGRELHLDMALDAMNYKVAEAQKKYSKKINFSNPVVHCPYFNTNVLLLEGSYRANYNPYSFRVLMCTEGNFEILWNNWSYPVSKGETVLVPAVITDFELFGKAHILEVSI